jgi:competence protein ComEA
VEPSGAPWRVIDSPDPASSPPAEDDRRDIPWIAIGAVIVAMVVAALAFVLASRSEPVIAVDGAASAGPGAVIVGADEPPGKDIVVEVGGAVARPGVYHLDAGARVGDAIAAAGGFGPRVDLALADRALNLAAPVRDGDEVRVPVRGEAASGNEASGPVEAGGLVDLNRATAEALDTLPGIGPATAAKIIAAREEQPFGSIEDLGTRKVVGPATLEKIRALVIVGS